MISYDPSDTLAAQAKVPAYQNRIVQQTDILPSLIDRLGFDDRVVAFGQSLHQQPLGWQVYFGNDFYCLVSNNPDDPSQHDITVLCGRKEIGKPENIRFLKAVVQQYFHRVMNNQLIAK